VGRQEIRNQDTSRDGAENIYFVGITAELSDEKLASLMDSENPWNTLFSTIGILSESFKLKTT
jgi:hypothetical protein